MPHGGIALEPPFMISILSSMSICEWNKHLKEIIENKHLALSVQTIYDMLKIPYCLVLDIAMSVHVMHGHYHQLSGWDHHNIIIAN